MGVAWHRALQTDNETGAGIIISKWCRKGMSKENKFSVWENNPFIEGLFEYMDSPRGQLADEVREVTWQMLETVDVDAADRKLIWEDGRRLSIDESVQRIYAECPEYPVDLIEGRLISWLEMEFTPKGYSQEQMDLMDRLTEEWVDDHCGQRKSL